MFHLCPLQSVRVQVRTSALPVAHPAMSRYRPAPAVVFILDLTAYCPFGRGLGTRQGVVAPDCVTPEFVMSTGIMFPAASKNILSMATCRSCILVLVRR